MPPLTLNSVQFDSQVVTFSGEIVKSVTFGNSFATAPQVTANSKVSVNVWASAVTTLGCNIHTSAPLTGDVLVQAVGSK